MKNVFAAIIVLFFLTNCNQQPGANLTESSKTISGDVLPFPVVPSASTAGETLAESKHVRRNRPEHLPKDAPNIMIVMIDDIGFGSASTFVGEINTPNLTKIASEGIVFNQFHTTALCSPSRAALLTGRNHTNVGNGTIAERALDFDGYSGIIPKEAATVAEVLKNYGYSTSAYGKWHNTPANQTTTQGPFEYWPTNYVFEHFYGFLGGETSQYEPRLVNDFTPIEPPKKVNYHLSADLADNAIQWMDQHNAFAPDKPFFLYFAPGAAHGPHQIFKEWADKYKGKFDDGWDAYRERVFKRQKAMGWIPANTQLTPRHPKMASWESIPESEKPFQRRLMEVFAGYVEHVDAQVGRVLDALEKNGQKENTIVIYIWGDNGSSPEGTNGTISELLTQNQISNTIQQQLATLEKLGGLDVLGSPLTDNVYNAAWGWAGNTPFKNTKVSASHFGGTQNPLIIRWPKGIKADKTPRSQFHHLNDIVPTIYDVLGINAPKEVNGYPQMKIDGISMKYTFDNANAPAASKTQFFDINGSRGIYKDGWYACTFGPLVPWRAEQPNLSAWDSRQDVWELYNIKEDFSQYNDLASMDPEKLKEMKALFMEEAKKNQDFPIGAAVWTRLHPEDGIGSPYKSWTFNGSSTRMPEFSAPGLGKRSNKVTIDIQVPANANGVLFALGGSSGGLSCFIENGKLVYEYNMMIIEKYTIETKEKLSPGNHQLSIVTNIAKPGAPAEIVISIDGKPAATGTVNRTVPGAFTASETFDVGTDLGSPVSMRYHKKAPFKFNGLVNKMTVDLF